MHNASPRPHPVQRPLLAGVRTFAVAAVALALVSAASAAQGGTASATLQVRAVVRQFLRMQLLSQPHWMDLSESDIAAGHVDVPLPVQLAVESNSPNEYMIVFACNCEYVQGARVRVLDRSLQIGPEATPLRWKPTGRRDVLEFGFRFTLPPDARPGRYPWPIQVSVSPA